MSPVCSRGHVASLSRVGSAGLTASVGFRVEGFRLRVKGLGVLGLRV